MQEDFLNKMGSIPNLPNQNRNQELEERLGKWEEAQNKIETLKETTMEERNKFEALTKENKKSISNVPPNSAQDFNRISSAQLLENKNGSALQDASLSNLLPMSWIQRLFQISNSNSEAVLVCEIKEVQKNVHEDLTLLEEALTQLDKDQNAEIAELEADIKKLKILRACLQFG